MLLNTSAQFLTALLPAGRILLIKELVDAVHAGFGQGEDQLIAVAPLLAGLAGLQMLEAGLEAVQGHSAAAMREQTSWKLQERVLDQAAGVGLDAFERREFFDRMQRARQAAYYRAYGIFRDAQVLVFDEPTAALDPRAELEVFRQFLALSEGKSAVFVSHRMASARVADRILVLSQGQVLEEGTHAELMQRRGEYARMFSLQAQWYQQEAP